jgi:hypothetical protein
MQARATQEAPQKPEQSVTHTKRGEERRGETSAQNLRYHERVAVIITPYTRIWVVLCSNLDRDIGYPGV